MGADKPRELNARQLAFVAASLTSRNTEEAAKKAGIGLRTAHRWKRLPEVRTAIQRERAELIAASADIMGAAMLEAVEFLLSELRDKNARPPEKLAAARVILSTGPGLLELRDLSERLRVLEERAELQQARQQ